MKHITIDGRIYRVRVVFDSLARSFAILDGPNSGTNILGAQIRDILGTQYSYTMSVEPDPKYPEDYDAFYEVISSPQATHTVVVPYGQSTLTYNATILTGEDKLGPTLGGFKRWHGLTVTFNASRPQRSAV